MVFGGVFFLFVMAFCVLFFFRWQRNIIQIQTKMTHKLKRNLHSWLKPMRYHCKVTVWEHLVHESAAVRTYIYLILCVWSCSRCLVMR